MKLGKKGVASISAIIIAVVLFTVTILSLSGVTTAVSTTCNSCSECNSKINSGSYDTVYLALDINDQTGNCIIFNVNNTVFDCNGYTIDGDDTGTDRGIIIDRKSNNTIRNCTITDFYYGIYLFSARNNNLYNNNATSNTDHGFHLESSNTNTIKNNMVDFNYDGVYLSQSLKNNIVANEMCANTRYDIFLAGSPDNYGGENTCDNPDGWNDESATGCKYPCTVAANCTDVYDNMIITTNTTLCPRIYNIADAGAVGVIIIGASNIMLDCNGATLNGAASGVGIYHSGFNYVTMKNCNIYNYSTGIYLASGSRNTLLENYLQYNTQYGI
ncbi:MAG: right-handed parallel beta-helix repeat-containing protein, partial [Thaumarchaeota archaeon]|nr:right-handed parallel beta-helix repeat-containing protein [Nitrososphaerota archaeon]